VSSSRRLWSTIQIRGKFAEFKMKTTRPILPAPAAPIRTPRLLLRPFHPSDLADFHVLRSQTNVMVWTTSGKVDVDQDATQTWMNRFLPPNDATTFCLSIEELNEPGRVIGSVGCHVSEPAEVGYVSLSICIVSIEAKGAAICGRFLDQTHAYQLDAQAIYRQSPGSRSMIYKPFATSVI
jgi:RimJ/RimL family protein N-acetyltransferase